MPVEIKIAIEELRKRKLFLATPCYGGMTTGMYSRSVADLSAMCTHYGIPLQIYMLFNESLIPRARNYSVDEFIRSDSTHMLFIDSDIGFNPNDVIAMLALQSDESEYDVVCAGYPKKSVHGSTLIDTEDGKKTIKWICDNKYFGRVRSIDESGKSVWNPIVQHHINPNDKKWVEVLLSKHRLAKKLICTYDHEISMVDDPLRPQVKFVRADQMVGKNTVVVPSNKFTRALYNPEIVSAMIGSLIGDSNISKRSNRLSIGHGEEQKAYLEFKQSLFGGVKYKAEAYENGYSDKSSWHLSCPVNAQTKRARQLFYDEATGKRTIKKILPYLDDIGLAIWYMDDGCLKKSGNPATAYYCSLATAGLPDEDQETLVEFFLKNYGFDVKIDVQRAEAKGEGVKEFKGLRLLNKDADSLFSRIAKYIPECMEYKLPPKYRGGDKHSYNTELLDFALMPVEAVNRIESHSNQYDIGVENNHNFVGHSVYVSNCIAWEKIKVAVDKGLADENPNDLEKYVGDFVFNAKSGKNQIPIGEPCEVLEAGTGFMMIRKNTFKELDKHFPELSYRPDHVRTAQFDGTREIKAYFDCVIDRGYSFGDLKKVAEKFSNVTDPAEYVILSKEIQELLDREKTASKRYLSEDYFMCQLVQKAGMRVWLLPWVKTQHVGTYVFGGSLEDLAKVGVNATADINVLQKNRENETRRLEKK